MALLDKGMFPSERISTAILDGCTPLEEGRIRYHATRTIIFPDGIRLPFGTDAETPAEHTAIWAFLRTHYPDAAERYLKETRHSIEQSYATLQNPRMNALHEAAMHRLTGRTPEETRAKARRDREYAARKLSTLHDPSSTHNDIARIVMHELLPDAMRGLEPLQGYLAAYDLEERFLMYMGGLVIGDAFRLRAEDRIGNILKKYAN